MRLQYLSHFLVRFWLFGGYTYAVVTGQQLLLAPPDMFGFTLTRFPSRFLSPCHRSVSSERRTRPSVNALSVTVTVEALIASAAHSGLSSTPKLG